MANLGARRKQRERRRRRGQENSATDDKVEGENPAPVDRVMSNLPEDIIEAILSYLPAKSLIRFTSVCKHWLSLFSDPYFIEKTHLNQLRQSNHHHRLVLTSKSSANLFFLDDNFNAKFRRFPLPAPHGIKVIGSVNGLLCVAALGEYSSIVLWNPLSKNCNTLPKSNFIRGVANEVRVMGFGYDSSIDDYKIVRVFTQFTILTNKVDIYSLKTNTWRKIKLKDVPTNVSFTKPYVGSHVNGCIYWCATQFLDDGDQSIQWIVCFDLKEEKLRLVNLPRDLMDPKVRMAELSDDVQRLFPVSHDWFGDYTSMRGLRLVDARGRLGLVQGCIDLHEVCLWTMMEDNTGVKFWSEKTVISHPTYMFPKPMLFMENGELLLKCKSEIKDWVIKGKENKLAIYNKDKESFSDVFSFNAGGWDCAVYTETLISPYGGTGLSSKKI